MGERAVFSMPGHAVSRGQVKGCEKEKKGKVGAHERI